MTNAPITTAEQPEIGHPMNDMATKCDMPQVALIETICREQEPALASPRLRGVLRELALARWRGSPAQVSLPSQSDDGH